MHGLRSIENINTEATRQQLAASALKAEQAKAQNHPKAEEFQRQHEELKAKHS